MIQLHMILWLLLKPVVLVWSILIRALMLPLDQYMQWGNWIKGQLEAKK